MQTFKTLACCVILTLLIGACGQKGSLYLPGEVPQAQPATDTAPPNQEDDGAAADDGDSGP